MNKRKEPEPSNTNFIYHITNKEYTDKRSMLRRVNLYVVCTKKELELVMRILTDKTCHYVSENDKELIYEEYPYIDLTEKYAQVTKKKKTEYEDSPLDDLNYYVLMFHNSDKKYAGSIYCYGNYGQIMKYAEEYIEEHKGYTLTLHHNVDARTENDIRTLVDEYNSHERGKYLTRQYFIEKDFYDHKYYYNLRGYYEL